MNEEVKAEEKIKKVVKKAKKPNAEIEKLTQEKAELADKVLRLTAEMQNMSRRFEQEKANTAE